MTMRNSLSPKQRADLLSLAASAMLEAAAADRLMDTAKAVRAVCPELMTLLADIGTRYRLLQRLANDALCRDEGEGVRG